MAREDIKTDAEREEIVFGKSIDWQEVPGGVRRFRGLDPAKGQRLIDEDYLDPEDRQNRAPSAGDIVDFALRYGAKIDGYVVRPDRDDARISLEGLEIPARDCDAETVAAFAERFRHADEFRADVEHGCSCWFD